MKRIVNVLGTVIVFGAFFGLLVVPNALAQYSRGNCNNSNLQPPAAPGLRNVSIPTCSAIALPPTCSRLAPTCTPFRSC